MRPPRLITSAILLSLTGTLYGCATNTSTPPPPTPASAPSATSNTSPGNATGKTEKKASSEDNRKAAKKISMSIGEEVSDFSITNQQAVDAPAGYDGTQYTVKTKAGKTYKCEILEPSGFGKAMTWGMASGASAMCTDFTKGSKDRGKTNKASCNDLLRAAGKC